MILIIGGRAQGKLDWAKNRFSLADADIARDFAGAAGAKALYALHDAIAASLRAGRSPEDEVNALVSANPDIIIICDEIGGGVVPIDPFEREWRERVGRICCELAARAERVERVLCGISMRLK
jgi:adenosyl cobinamide kinase/adenosyl cobinamide phosphate guanylyltransferase